MDILVLNDLVAGGGVENVMYQLVHHLRKNNKVTVISIFDQSEEFEKLYPNEVKYYPYYAKKYCEGEHNRYSLLRFLKKFVRRLRCFLLRCRRYDVVLVLKEGDSMKLGVRFRAKKRFAWVHADYRLTYWTNYCFGSGENEVAYMKKYDKVVCVSEAVRESVGQVIGQPGNLVVKLNPIDVSTIKKKSNEELEILEEYMKSRIGNRPIFISMGGLYEQKGYMRLLDACAKLKEEFGFELWILGEGEQRAEIERVIQNKQLDNVILWGNQDNPFPFLKKANWYVSASLGESYGLALQEALILGVPVLATTCPAFEECLSKEEALLVPNTAEALYDGLYRILNDVTLETKYKQGIGRKTQEQLFTSRLTEIEELWRESV